MSLADFFRKKNSGVIAKDRLKLVLVSRQLFAGSDGVNKKRYYTCNIQIYGN